MGACVLRCTTKGGRKQLPIAIIAAFYFSRLRHGIMPLCSSIWFLYFLKFGELMDTWKLRNNGWYYDLESCKPIRISSGNHWEKVVVMIKILTMNLLTNNEVKSFTFAFPLLKKTFEYPYRGNKIMISRFLYIFNKKNDKSNFKNKIYYFFIEKIYIFLYNFFSWIDSIVIIIPSVIEKCKCNKKFYIQQK